MAKTIHDDIMLLATTVTQLSNLTGDLADRIIALEEKVKELEAPKEPLSFNQEYEKVRMK